MRTDVVRDGLEVTQGLLHLVDDGLVLQDGAVVRQVDGRRLGVELAGDALGFRVALAERLQGCDGLCDAMFWSEDARCEIRGKKMCTLSKTEC